MKLELLSPNLVHIIDGCLKNPALSKLIYYNTQDPYSQPDFNPSIIAPFGSEQRVLPYPFDVQYKDEERTQLHIYYPDLRFKNKVVEQTIVWFDIVVHKRLWLFEQDGKKLIRPYEIASRIANQFDGTLPNTKNSVGSLDFLAMAHISVNQEFDALRLEAKMTTF